ncbi:MAG: shikimate kinase [Verrucomicrobiota bacterium]
MQNIALIGFMGTGKSSVGRLAAELLQFEFVDTDDLIEAQCGVTIEEIFKQQGESAFRQLERQAVENLSQRQKMVIATGGGLVADPANLASLKTHSLIVCLWASPETIWERVQSQTHRPLLQTADPLGKIRELLALRDPFYRQADVLIQTGQRSPKEVVQQVLHQFQFARQ